MASHWKKALSLPIRMGRAGVGGTEAARRVWPLGSDDCSSLPSLQKMLMKQQDRLEEREQDIEEQLYKLESDKRLVEVTLGLSPHGTMGTGSCIAGARWAGRREDVQGSSGQTDLLSPFQAWQSSFWGTKMCLGLPCGLVGPRVSWKARNKAVLKYGPPCPQLSTALPSHPLHPEWEGRLWRWEIPK